eukprot:m.83591 g.83591  ORF g.83591 m.83591 type:complete len:403 (-) comp14985_c0_seq1:161-1369(-)
MSNKNSTVPQERNQDATVYVGGLDEQVTEGLLWEFFLQAGPVVNVHMPKDRVTGLYQGYGFVEFLSEEDADYAIKIMQMIKLYGKPIRVNKSNTNKMEVTVGANLFISNLDPEVDEKLLYDTFSAFGVIMSHPKIGRDEAGVSKGYGFVNFATFESSDAAIAAMDGQFLCNRPISVKYAFKKGTDGVRHGSASERFIAAQNPIVQNAQPHQFFADKPTGAPGATTFAVRPPPGPPPPPSAPRPLAPHMHLPATLQPGMGMQPPMHPPPPAQPMPPQQYAPPQQFAPPPQFGGAPYGGPPMPYGRPPPPQGPYGGPPMGAPPMGGPPMGGPPPQQQRPPFGGPPPPYGPPGGMPPPQQQQHFAPPGQQQFGGGPGGPPPPQHFGYGGPQGFGGPPPMRPPFPQ